MKRNLRALGALASLAVAAATFVAPAQAFPALSLVLTPAANVVFGGTVGVDIFISGLTGAVGGTLGGYNFDLSYDSSRMTFGSFSADPDTKMGDVLNPATDVSTGNAGALVNFNVLSGFFLPADEATLAGLQGTGFKLGHADFTALNNAGFAAFGLANVSLSDYSGANTIANTATGGQLCVVAPGSTAPACGNNNVPEPASALLVAAALAGLALSRRQSKAA